MLETIVLGLMVLLGVAIGALYINRKMNEIVENLTENAKNSIENWLNTEQGQKALFSIGVLIGNGAKAGFGITPKSGKFKLTDLIGQGIANWFLSKVPVVQQSGQEQLPPQISVPQA